MRLNLGCGNDVRDGYTNVDLRETHPSVMVCDLSRLPWPFADGSAEEILMLDFLEHFPYAQTKQILLECYRVLTPEGTVVIQVPDAEILGAVFSTGRAFQCNQCGALLNSNVCEDVFTDGCWKCEQTFDELQEAAMKRMFGGQDHLGNFHHTTFTKRSLKEKARKVGLVFTKLEEEDHQRANWNFKASFRKGDLW